MTDNVHYRLDRCSKVLAKELRGLPVYGVGHGLGALLTVLHPSRWDVHYEGNALLAFSNKPASDIVPFLSPVLAPAARYLKPLLMRVRSRRRRRRGQDARARFSITGNFGAAVEEGVGKRRPYVLLLLCVQQAIDALAKRHSVVSAPSHTFAASTCLLCATIDCRKRYPIHHARCCFQAGA